MDWAKLGLTDGRAVEVCVEGKWYIGYFSKCSTDTTLVIYNELSEDGAYSWPLERDPIIKVLYVGEGEIRPRGKRDQTCMKESALEEMELS